MATRAAASEGTEGHTAVRENYKYEIFVCVLGGQMCWSAQFGEINWHKMWLADEKFCFNNKVKEVLFKIFQI